ncbi:molybdopterin-dependent oxidoreductase alpha subunit [Catalinimonas alkaloidigena]|uniref:FdhF/YdeP family oxidoreductase n=1 Tax=Catalinimonas alkaloidigena TaxID=1075417 RepID=UPI002404D4A6|nr:FdhF/YdeP family oxidoreductase [Catalinimonas alkaloidigena]MDF9801004.1 molybdopterin-dependent oxidoreductase alpha subunit [Catalinimonas alkaloidigena]
MSKATNLSAEKAEEQHKIKLTQPKKVAAGLPAILSSAKHVYGDVGIVEGTRLMSQINQFDGFDCPGCAWPDPDDKRSPVEFCENGAKAVAEEATTDTCNPAFFKAHSVEELRQWTDYELGKSGRLTEPMILREGNDYYEAINWDEAFDIIGKQLQQLNSPDEAIFYTSGRTSNEAAFLYQLFVRQYGTNNLPDCSNMCHESSGTGLSETVGIGKGSVTLEDFYEAEVIMIMGQNPGTNHPRMLTALQKAKHNGAKIISVNPLPETGLMSFKNPQHPWEMAGKGTALTDIFLQLRLNADVPLLKALMKILLEKEKQNPGMVLDEEFIRTHTSGYEALLADLQKYDIDELISQTAISKAQIEETAELLASRQKIIICWAMGLTQHKNGVDNVREIVNLLLLKGSIGKAGAGTCPVRGHSNVQGDRTMGIWEKLKPEFRQKLKEAFNFEPPAKDGYDVMHSMEAMANGKAKFFMGMGGNFLSATPDTEYTAKGLRQCKMTVHVSTKLNRSHLVHGKTALILPCLGRTELDMQVSGPQFLSVENSTGVVHQTRGGKDPASPHLLSEPKIVAELAKATLESKSTVDWDEMVSDYDHIRDAIEKTVDGFDAYNIRVRNSGGFYLPNGARVGKFNTDTGKAKFTVNENPDHQLAEDDFLMMTIRSHDQYNTTIYGLHDRYRGIAYDRRVVLMNKEDIRKHGLKKEDKVNLYSYYDGSERSAEGFLVVPYSIPRRCVATYFPEANTLVPHNRMARKSNQPISKSVVIKIKKSE